MRDTKVTTRETDCVDKELDGRTFTIPIYEIDGHRYFQDSIDIKKLEIDKEAQPRAKNDNQVRNIKNSIKNKVLMQPLLVREDKKRNRYLITEGQHRFYACRELGFEWVPCIVYKNMENALALQCGIEANAEDRAKGLSGGDMAAKAHGIMEETRKVLKQKLPKDKITEDRILKEIGKTSKSSQKKYLVADKIRRLQLAKDWEMSNFVADRQDRYYPITTRNLAFFLQRLMRATPASSKDEHLRTEETLNLVRLTNIIASKLLIGAWNPDAKAKKEKTRHDHAKNICKRHPLEALGQLCAELVSDAGGSHHSSGAIFCESAAINWSVLEKRLDNLLNSHAWDQQYIYTLRSVNELLREVTAYVRM